MSPNSRREALVDLGLWFAAVALTVPVGLLMTWAKVPASARLIPGEPIAMIYLVAATTWVMRRRRQGWPALGLRWPLAPWRTIGLALAGLVGVYALAATLVYTIFRPLHLAAPDLRLVEPLLATPGSYALMMLVTWTTVAFGEEMLFRGFLFSRLERLFGGRVEAGPWGGPQAGPRATAAAWLTQGLLFGLPHAYQGLGGILVTTVMGLVFGAVYLRARRNLLPCILMHGLIDTLSLTALFYVTTHGIKLDSV